MKFRTIAISATIGAMALSLTAAPRRSASGISVSADIDSSVVVMGDLTKLHVTVDMPASASTDARLLDFPELTAGQEYIPWNGVDIVAVDSNTTINNDRRRIEFAYTIQAFDPGTLTLPPFAVLGDNGTDTAFSGVLTLKVLPVDVDSLETIHPLESVVSPARKWYDWIPNWLVWVIGIGAVLAIAISAYLLLRKRKEEIEILRTKPVPPYELAISRLSKLRSEGLDATGHEKQYYTELVDILRQYLQGRFGINAMEMTSTQIVKALRANPETRLTADQMRAVLSTADFVKFAKVRPLPDDNVKAFNRAQDFVEQTKPAPEPEAESPETAKTENPRQ